MGAQNIPKRMPYTRALPDLEIAEDIYDNAYRSTYSIKEDQMRECRQRQGALGAEENVRRNQRMA